MSGGAAGTRVSSRSSPGKHQSNRASCRLSPIPQSSHSSQSSRTVPGQVLARALLSPAHRLSGAADAAFHIELSTASSSWSVPELSAAVVQRLSRPSGPRHVPPASARSIRRRTSASSAAGATIATPDANVPYPSGGRRCVVADSRSRDGELPAAGHPDGLRHSATLRKSDAAHPEGDAVSSPVVDLIVASFVPDLQPTAYWRHWASPEQVQMVTRDLGIATDQVEIAAIGLSHQNPVKRIAVMRWKA